MHSVVRFSGPRQVSVETVPGDELVAGSVRVRTRYSGISAGTELTAYRGTNPYLTRSWDPDRRLFVDGEPAAIGAWGYSEVGEVLEVAPDVAGAPGVPEPGDVVWGIWGHRGEAVVPAAKLTGHALAPGLDPLAATFARVGAVALNAVLAAGVHLGELVAIFGQGVIGLLATRMATLSGGDVVAVDPVAGRRSQAAKFGAMVTVDALAGSVAEQIRTLGEQRGADTAIELSGTHSALHEAVRSVGPGGRVVAAGFYQGEAVGLRLGEEFHHNRVELVCSQIGGVPRGLADRWDADRLTRTFLRLVAGGAVDPVPLVSHLVPVSGAADAYRQLDERPAEALQVVLDFTGGDR